MSNDPNPHPELAFFLEEYKTRSAEILEKGKEMYNIIIFTFAFYGAIVYFILTKIEDSPFAIPTITNHLLFLFPTPFFILGLASKKNQLLICWNAEYIHKRIKKRTSKLYKINDQLDYERFISNKRKDNNGILLGKSFYAFYVCPFSLFLISFSLKLTNGSFVFFDLVCVIINIYFFDSLKNIDRKIKAAYESITT